ncbi:hypothetical protein [Actinomadura luteofluorescens]|uniref:hypothetical protein n=1 Tax=Actinomadura luteofluorescens TaxID=46163 RepID=UPI003D94229C
MRREDRFVMSHKPYAVDLSTLSGDRRTGYQGREYYSGVIRAVWFRRRRRSGNGPILTVACIGTLWDSQDTVPADGRAFLEAHTDGRYGGHTLGRWDGSGYWGSENPDVMAQHLEVLRPMLDGYANNPRNPAIPAGFDGWWTFHGTTGGTP